MALKKWIVKNTDKALAKELAEECEVDSFLAFLAINRGISDPFELDLFLSDEPELDDPYNLRDMDLAAERVKAALEKNEKIAIFGDYDCDGVTATALLYSFLKSRDADIIYYIPNRITEGYGMKCDAVKAIAEQGINLIITVDNGINSIDEIAFANELGMDVVVTDHHLPQGDIPNAYAVVDPHRKDDFSGCENLSGVGVAFKLVCALSADSAPEELLIDYSQLVCLGTIGDIVPLMGENRIICKHGLFYINNAPIPGIAALKDVSSADKKEISVSSVSFSLVPRINAAGRMGNSDRAVELLLATELDEAKILADELDIENSERQAICEEIYINACEVIEEEKLFNNRVICIYGSGWHVGIIGIVASKIVERYNLPALVFSEEDGIMHGSGRSAAGLNLFEAVSYAESETITFGGHEMAVGATVELERFHEFSRLVNEYAENIPHEVSSITLDCRLRPEVINLDLLDVISRLQPYGAGNPEPVFGLFDAVITAIDPIKSGKFVKINVERDGYTFAVLCFTYNIGNFPFFVGNRIDIAFSPELNEFKGRRSVTLFAKQLRPSRLREDFYFESLNTYEQLKRGKITSAAESILPSRDEFAAVFGMIKKSTKILSEETISFKFHEFGYGKVKVILEAFCELGLIKYESDDMVSGYLINNVKEKVSLEDAEIIKRIKSIIE